jgi:hypothetical protein
MHNKLKDCFTDKASNLLGAQIFFGEISEIRRKAAKQTGFAVFLQSKEVILNVRRAQAQGTLTRTRYKRRAS